MFLFIENQTFFSRITYFDESPSLIGTGWMSPSKDILSNLLSADYILVENLDTYKYLKNLRPKIKAKIITFNPSFSITNNLGASL